MIESTGTEAVRRRSRLHGALADPHRLAIVDELVFSDRSPSELRARLNLDSNLLAHHLDVLERLNLIERSASQGDRRRRYVRLVPGTLAGLGVGGSLRVGRVVFVCTENAARSQLASALWNDICRTVPGCSGGTRPRKEVYAGAAAAAERRGLNLASAQPGPIPERRARDLLITVCDRAHEELKDEPDDRPHLHWSIPDPAAAVEPDAFDLAADLLDDRIRGLAPMVGRA